MPGAEEPEFGECELAGSFAATLCSITWSAQKNRLTIG